jgi:hypothetical protein
MHTDRCGNTNGQRFHTKGRRKENKINSLRIVIQRMWNMKCVFIPVITWGHRNINKRFKEKFRSRTRKTFDRLATEDSCTWNITCKAESTAA